MTKPLDPILGPDGKRLYVTAREHIGAEEVNAACEWTQRVSDALSREHSVGEIYGHHHRAFHPVGAVRFAMPFRAQGVTHDGHIYPESVLFGRTEAEYPGTFSMFIPDPANSPGTFQIHMTPGLPNNNYWVQVHGAPHPIQDGRRWFIFRYDLRSTTHFTLSAAGVPATGAHRGIDRRPLVAAIYAETRDF